MPSRVFVFDEPLPRSARGKLLRRALRDRVQDAVAESRRVGVPRARARGIFTDEEVFRLIS